MLTLEMCTRLKEAGFRQDTQYAWLLNRSVWIHITKPANPVFTRHVACPTADEIWGELDCNQKVHFITGLKLNTASVFCFESIETALAEYWLEVDE